MHDVSKLNIQENLWMVRMFVNVAVFITVSFSKKWFIKVKDILELPQMFTSEILEPNLFQILLKVILALDSPSIWSCF